MKDSKRLTQLAPSVRPDFSHGRARGQASFLLPEGGPWVRAADAGELAQQVE